MKSGSSHILTFVLMVVVGGLAFAAHRLWQSMHGPAAEQVVSDASAVDRSPKELLLELQQSVAELSALYEDEKQSQLRGAVTAPLPPIQRIDTAMESIRENKDESTEDMIAQATLAQLQGYFFAARLLPEAYGEDFSKLSSQLIEQSPDSSAAAQASILQFVSQLDLSKQIDASQLDALKKRAAACPDVLRGSAIYSLVAHELWTRGQKESAEAVLTAGTKQFKDTPGWRPLFNQMVAQGHLAAPKPTMKLGAFKHGSFDGKGCPPEPDTPSATSIADDVMAHQNKINKEFNESMEELRRDLKKDGWTHLEFKKKGKKPVVFID